MNVECSESIPSGKVKRIVAFRVAVVWLARAVLELATGGRLSETSEAHVKEIARGKT